MTTTHTAGPWTTYTERDGRISIESAYGSVAVVMIENCDSDQQVQADAQLIAAAPDLLAALEMVGHCTVVKDGVNGQQMWLTHQSVIDAVKAAILKATQGA